MSVDLRIYGIRKLTDMEMEELTGKTEEEIYRSRFFTQLFPSAPYDSRYRYCIDPSASIMSIRHMLTPVETAEGEVIYVYWEEELGYYWRNLSHDDPRIDEILDAVKGYIHYDQDYSIAPYELIGEYLNKHQPSTHDDEIIAISYG